jgi:hypothetical protein
MSPVPTPAPFSMLPTNRDPPPCSFHLPTQIDWNTKVLLTSLVFAISYGVRYLRGNLSGTSEDLMYSQTAFGTVGSCIALVVAPKRMTRSETDHSRWLFRAGLYYAHSAVTRLPARLPAAVEVAMANL